MGNTRLNQEVNLAAAGAATCPCCWRCFRATYDGNEKGYLHARSNMREHDLCSAHEGFSNGGIMLPHDPEFHNKVRDAAGLPDSSMRCPSNFEANREKKKKAAIAFRGESGLVCAWLDLV